MTRLKYITLGSSNTSLTFLHGDTLDHRQWQPQIDFFSPNFQVLTYDMSGYGQSPLPDGPVDHPNDLKQLLDSLHIQTTHLVGSSYGGEQAIDFALRFPTLVSSLTLIDTSLSGFPCTVNWDIGARSLPLGVVKQNWLDHEVFKYLQNNQPVVQQLSAMVHDYSGHYWLCGLPSLAPKHKAINRLRDIKVPTLIIVGQHDLDYFHNIATTLHKGVTHSELKIIPDSSHLPNLEQPELINQLIEKYLRINPLE